MDDYQIGTIVYKLIDDNKIEMLRVIEKYNDTFTLKKLNNGNVYRNVKLDIITDNYNILIPHIVISYVDCIDCERLLIKSRRESFMPDYIYDDALGYHYDMITDTIIGVKQMEQPRHLVKSHFYLIDDIKKTMEDLMLYNNGIHNIYRLMNDEILDDIYIDNRLSFEYDTDYEIDNNMIERYNIGMNLDGLNNCYRIVHGKSDIYLIKTVIE